MPGGDHAQDGQHADETAIGAAIAVMLIGLVRGMPNQAERESAEGSLPSG
jgi:hypothetical protein